VNNGQVKRSKLWKLSRKAENGSSVKLGRRRPTLQYNPNLAGEKSGGVKLYL